MKSYISIIVLSLMLATTVKAQNILIKNANLLTITNGVKENTDILIEQGKISKINKDIKVKDGIKIIDAKGMYVMPGIIDAHSHIGIDAVNEATHPATPEVHVGDAIDPGITITCCLHISSRIW